MKTELEKRVERLEKMLLDNVVRIGPNSFYCPLYNSKVSKERPLEEAETKEEETG